MNNDLQLIKLMQHFSNALVYIAEAITKNDQNSSARHELIEKAKKHLKKLDSEADELLLAQQHNSEPSPQLQQTPCYRFGTVNKKIT